ncbi:MAG: glutathione ABC transporter ATP-binding protein [Micrococcales bacterium]|nr:MAG: glutathione ABC transporter ATP-binding protein [Micrococcales bacterium]PIE26237.1 MAG: glutathione ABC transporter ATP-binding protein [Micrococcales bacterium]
MTDPDATHPPVLRVRNLSVTVRDQPLVREVDLDIATGERVGLIGESGSGKSLTALAVMGLLPDPLRATGSVHLDGGPDLLAAGAATLTDLRGRRMSMVFQEPMTALNPTMRIGPQVGEVMLLHDSYPREQVRSRVHELLAEVGIRDPRRAADSYPHQLSGGQRQRVVLAIALANDPALLICDEPTTALDVTVQAHVLDLITREVESRAAGMLFISHDLAVIATVCERVAVMQDGRIVETGTVHDILTDPSHPYTQKLVQASTLGAACRDERSQPERPLIEAVDLTRIYDSGAGLGGLARLFGQRPRRVTAVSEVSLQVQPGDRLGIVGESGSGKSTLLRMLAGLDQPTSGQISVDGKLVGGRPDRELRWLRHRLQVVFQDPRGSLDPRMRVADIVAEPMRALGVPGGRGRVRELLDLVGLDPSVADRFPHQFSGGQRQRIGIARALAPNPAILLADEPVSALDVSVRGQVLDLILDLVNRLGLTLVMVSHDLTVIRHVCSRVLVMRDGVVVEQGAAHQVYDYPEHPYTRQLVTAVPTVERALAGGTPHDLANGVTDR